MSTPIDLRNPGRTIHVGVILVDSETEILDIAPVDLLNGLSKQWAEDGASEFLPKSLQHQLLDFSFHWVNESGKPARVTSGAKIDPTDTFATCPPLDIALMGAHSIGYHLSEGEKEFIRKTFDNCAAFITICGGMLAPLEAGILEGRTATAPRFMLDLCRNTLGPNTTWVEKRYHNDGKLWTSGALLNGLELMRAFGEQTWGGEGTVMEFLLSIGSWPNRDLEYRDEKLLVVAA